MSKNISLSQLAQEVDTSLKSSEQVSPLQDLLKEITPSVSVPEQCVEKIRELLKNFQDIGKRAIHYPEKYAENILAMRMKIFDIIESASSTPNPEVQA